MSRIINFPFGYIGQFIIKMRLIKKLRKLKHPVT
jgi:hypothetical protein